MRNEYLNGLISRLRKIRNGSRFHPMNDFVYFALFFTVGCLIVNRRHYNRVRAAVRINHALVNHVRRYYTVSSAEPEQHDPDRSGRQTIKGVSNHATR